jgi:hypothetical protein
MESRFGIRVVVLEYWRVGIMEKAINGISN